MAGKRVWKHLAFQNFLGEASQTPRPRLRAFSARLTTRASPSPSAPRQKNPRYGPEYEQ
jgi:hypothetical protein